MSDSEPPGPAPAARSGGPLDDPFIRWARLGPAFAHLYPGLDAGAWYPAASVAAYFRSWLVRHPDRAAGAHLPRGLETAHFEFRGGVPRDDPWLSGQSPEDRQLSSAPQP